MRRYSVKFYSYLRFFKRRAILGNKIKFKNMIKTFF